MQSDLKMLELHATNLVVNPLNYGNTSYPCDMKLQIF